MPLRLRSAGGGSVQLNSPVALATDVSMEVPGYAGAKVLTDKTPGVVLQVVQAVKTDTMSATGALWMDVPGLSATITPQSASNKILVTVDLKGASYANSSVIRSKLLRNNTDVYVGDAAGSRPRSLGQAYDGGGTDNVYGVNQLGGTYLDSPNSTSAVTYKIQIGADTSDRVVFVNRTQADRDTAYYDSRVVSSITLMEIAA